MSYFGVFKPGRPTYKRAADISRILLGILKVNVWDFVDIFLDFIIWGPSQNHVRFSKYLPTFVNYTAVRILEQLDVH